MILKFITSYTLIRVLLFISLSNAAQVTLECKWEKTVGIVVVMLASIPR